MCVTLISSVAGCDDIARNIHLIVGEDGLVTTTELAVQEETPWWSKKTVTRRHSLSIKVSMHAPPWDFWNVDFDLYALPLFYVKGWWVPYSSRFPFLQLLDTYYDYRTVLQDWPTFAQLQQLSCWWESWSHKVLARGSYLSTFNIGSLPLFFDCLWKSLLRTDARRLIACLCHMGVLGGQTNI